MAKSKNQFSKKEAAARFEAALRGARIAGQKQMSDVSPKRETKKKRAHKRP